MYWTTHFLGRDGGSKYILDISPMDDEDYNYEEIELTLNQPFTVTYSENESIYSPIRTSTAQINIVFDEYLYDALRANALGTMVTLSRTTTDPRPPRPVVVWQGYLNNDMLDAPYEHCTESFSLNASDFLLKAKLLPYDIVGENKNIVSFKDIFEKFLNKVGGLDVYLPNTRLINKQPIKLENIQISEFNFFTSDTDKGWSYYEVIEEFCKYFGFTALQWGNGLYFMDYESFSRRDEMVFQKYTWVSGYDEGSLVYEDEFVAIEGGTINISADDYTRNGGRVTFDTFKNKVKVNCNYYDAGIVVPDIFDDNALTYLFGGKNEVRPITQPMGRPRYIGADTKINFESEEKNYYYRKELDNPNYEEKWYTAAESAVTKQQVDDFTEFCVNRWTEFDTPTVTTLYGWRWQCYWGASPYTSVANWELEQFGIGIDIESTGSHTEIGSYQQWQNGDNSKTFEVEFLGRYAWQNQWLANFDLKYYSATAAYQGSFTFIADNQWYPYYENEGDANPVFYYCVNPWQGAVGFIPFSNDWRISTTYPIYSNEAPDYMPQIYQDVYLPIQYTGITGAGADYTVFNYRSDKVRTYTATLWYADYSASTTFTVEAHSALTVTTNILGIQINREEDRDKWALQIVSEEGTSGATTWSRLNIPSPVYPQNVELIKKWIGSRVIELADVPKKEKNPTNKLNFTRYLLLAQHGTPIDKNNVVSNHLPLYELKSLNAPAVFVADGTYFYIQCDALFSRYWGIDYIGDWAQDKSRIYHNDGGPTQNNTPALVFCFGIGDKYWDGYKWVNSKCNFKVQLYNSGDDGSQEEQKDLKCWNMTMPIKNQLGWAQWTSGEGYKIKFDESLDLNGKITFEICSPVQLQAAPNTSMPGGGSWASFDSSFNGYCWISDLKVGIAIRNDIKYDNADVIYENVIDEDSVNELNEISLKLTTYPQLGKLGYSHVGYNNKMIKTVADTSLNAEEQVPEEAIVERYYNQYSTPTRKEYITLGLESTPFMRHYDSYWDCDYAVIGQTIDFATGENSLSLEEVKKNDSPLDVITNIKYKMNGGNEPSWWQSPSWGEGFVTGHEYDSATGEGSISFKDVPTEIPARMFSGNSNLVSLELPYSIQTIKQNAISGNTNLTAITSNAFIAPYFQSGALSGNSHQNGSVLTIPEGADYAVYNNNWYERLGSYWTNRTLTFAESGATVSFKGGSYNVAYSYDGTEKITVSSISLNGVSAEIQDGNMVYTVPANPSVTTGRTFTITITNRMGASATFTVTQGRAVYSLQQNILEATVDAAGNMGESLQIIYDGPVTNLTTSATESWIHVEMTDWGTNEDGTKTCTLNYWADPNRSEYDVWYPTSRTCDFSITDSVNTVSFHITQQPAIIVYDIEIFYKNNGSWFKAPSYNGAMSDFLIPSGTTGNEVIMRIHTSTSYVPQAIMISQTSGYTTGYYAGMFVNGAKMVGYDHYPIEEQGRYFRFNAPGLGANQKWIIVNGSSQYQLREIFKLDKLFLNAEDGTFPGGGYSTKVLSFDLSSYYGNSVFSKNTFKVHLRQ